MESLQLTSEFRPTKGKSAIRKLRASGRIPAVIYGHDDETISLSLDESDVRKVLAKNWETAIIELKVTGKVKKECEALIKDIQHHPATGRVLHVDFQYVRRGEKINLNVPVEIIGVARGVKEMGGVLEHGPRELAVRCMPRHIPDHVEIDVSELDIHDAIHVREVVGRYPEVEFLDEPDTTLVIVVPPRLEVEETPEEVEEGEEEPEVISKGKEDKAEEEGEGEGD